MEHQAEWKMERSRNREREANKRRSVSGTVHGSSNGTGGGAEIGFNVERLRSAHMLWCRYSTEPASFCSRPVYAFIAGK